MLDVSISKYRKWMMSTSFSITIRYNNQIVYWYNQWIAQAKEVANNSKNNCYYGEKEGKECR